MRLTLRCLSAMAAPGRRLLMCDPACFDVKYEINPWMKGKSVDKDKAIQQWHNLKDTFQKHGVKVEVMQGDPSVPDIVYTANAALVRGNTAWVSTFLNKERQPETQLYAAWFRSNGYKVIVDPTWVFEGQGDARFAAADPSDTSKPFLFVGHGVRTKEHGINKLDEAFDCDTFPVKLTNPAFFHLDTCFCPIKPGLAIAYPGAIDPDSIAALERRLHVIRVNKDDAERFACNCVPISHTHVVLPTGCGTLTEALAKQGVSSIPVDVSEFLKGGGAMRCLTLDLD